MDGSGQLTENFLLWCRKTQHLTDEQWRRAFKKIEDEVILNKSKGKDSFPPSYAEFVGLSQPSLEDSGLPDVDIAFAEACREAGRISMHRRWTHPAVYFAASDVGFFDLKSATSNLELASAKKRFTTAYRNVCGRVLSGDRLSLPEDVRISHRPKKACPPPQGMISGLIGGL